MCENLRLALAFFKIFCFKNPLNISKLKFLKQKILNKSFAILGFDTFLIPNWRYKKDENGNYITNSGTIVDNLIIKNADLKEYHYAQTSRGYSGIAANALQIAPYGLMPVQIISDLIKSSTAMLLPDSIENSIMNIPTFQIVNDIENKIDNIKIKTEIENKSEKSTALASNINIGRSALINSSDGFALIASNLATADITEIISKNNLDISDGHNKQSSSSSEENIKLDSGIQIGNAYADAAYAIINAIAAAKKIEEARNKLEKIEALEKDGKASPKAVERAQYQLYLALLNSGLSDAQAMIVVNNASTTSETLGFYGSAFVDITKSESSFNSQLTKSITSNLTSGNSLNLTSATSDLNITGANLSSINGNLNLSAALGNVNIQAGESTYSQESKSNSRNLGGNVGTNGVSANIGFSEAGSYLDQTIYSNSQLTANNGRLKINSKEDINIAGANLLAQDIIINAEGNLLLKSKQNLTESDSYSIGANIGISSRGGKINGGNAAFNIGNAIDRTRWDEPKLLALFFN